MPAIKDIDILKDKLNSLGNEPALMEKAGKKIHDITPESGGVPDDISALLDNFSEDVESSRAAENAVPDFNTLLNTDTSDLDSFSLPQDKEFDTPDKIDDLDADLPVLDAEADDDIEEVEEVAEVEAIKEEDFALPDLDSLDLPTEEAGIVEDLDLSSLGSADADASSEETGIVEDFDLSSLGSADAEASSEEAGIVEDFDLSSLGSADADASSEEAEIAEDIDLPDLDSLDADTSDDIKETEQLDDLENIFGDDSIELNDDPNALLDDFSEQEDNTTSSDDLGLDTLDDIFKDKEQNGESPFEAIESIEEEGAIDSAAENELADDLSLSDIDIEPAEQDLDIELPDLDAKEEDSQLPEFDSEEASADSDLSVDLPDLDEEASAEQDLDIELPDLGMDLGTEEAKEEDFALPEIDSEEVSADSDLSVDLPDLDEEASAEQDLDIELPDLDADLDMDLGTEEAKEEELSLLELDSEEASADSDLNIDLPDLEEDGSADEKFDIGSVDTLSMDDEFEKKEDEDIIVDDIEQQDDLSSGNDYNLKDFGDKFGSVDEFEDTPVDNLLVKAADKPKKEKDISGIKESEDDRSENYYISSEKLKRVVETLSSYPGNLKIYIEDLIGNRDVPKAHLDNLVNKLVAGISAREAADLLFKITGKRIRIPAHYKRKTWQELEREKATLAYFIKNRVAPFAGKALAASFAILFVLFLINNFIWKPIHSSMLYKKGYQALVNDNFPESEKNFLKASNIRASKKQFYRYADALVEKREYSLAETKYLQLLGISLSSEREKPVKERQRGFFPGDKKGFIDYSVLKTYYQGEYGRAERIIDDFLYMKENKWDYDMLIKKIDNYLNWAEVDNVKYNSAEFIINDSLSKFGARPDFYLRKITHGVRSGKLLEMKNEAVESIEDSSTGRISPETRKYYSVLGQYRGFIEGLKGKNIDPYIAADLYGYHITNEKNLDGIDRELVKISNVDKKLLEPHSQLARLWNFLERPEMERRSLKIVEKLSEEFSIDHIRKNYPHSYMYAIKQRKDFEITAFNRLGNFEYEDQNILIAQKYYQRAISEYERNIDILGVNPKYAKLYEDNGDLFYYSAGKYNEALREYYKAENTGYRESGLSYKIGFIYYRNKNYKEASERFYEVSVNRRDNEAALFAFANSSFYNNIYSPAMAYYEYVIEKLEHWKDRQLVFELERRKDQRIVMQRLMEAYNNLGTTLYKLSEKSQNSSYYSNALLNLTKSAELYDFMSRDPVTVNRTFTKPLAQLNLQYVLLNSGRPVTRTANNVIPYSPENIRMDGPIIYSEIDMDMHGRIEMILESQ